MRNSTLLSMRKSYHLHIVLHVDDEKAKKLSDKEVVIRWHKLFKGTQLTQVFLQDAKLDDGQKLTLKETIAKYREQLFSISWFMRILSEDIARRANKEDDCKGRFWEGRFKSQALLDEAALLACMAYVDLNPVRAKMANTLEQSEYTSIQKRIDCAKNGKQPKMLLPFAGSNVLISKALPFDLEYYVELVDLTGSCMRNDKRGYINKDEPILERLDIAPENWITLTTEFTRIFHGAVGREKMLQRYNGHLNRQSRANLATCRRYLR